MKKTRSLSLDAMRGITLLIMCINHLGRFFPEMGGVVKFFYGIFGIATSAEVFVAISAYVILRASMDTEGNFYSNKILIKKAKERVIKLYTIHVLLLLFVILLSLGSKWEFAGQIVRVDYPPLEKFIYGLIFLFQPPLFDILPLYLFFTLLNPLLIAYIKEKKLIYVIGFSMLLWLSVQCFQELRYERFTNKFVFPHFHLIAWQFLYCSLTGIYMISEHIRKNRNLMLLSSGLLCIGLFVYGHLDLGYSMNDYYLTSNQYMGPLRILSVLSLSIFFISFNTELEIFNKFRIFAWIGKNSLPLFSLHVIIYHINKFYIHRYAYYLGFTFQLVIYILLLMAPIFIWYLWRRFVRP